jgi:hypothetical protein
VTDAAIPSDSLVARALDRIDYSDAYAAPLPSGVSSAVELARAIFSRPAPMWVRILFAIRNAGARVVGLRAAPRPDSIVPIGNIYQTRDDEVLFGLDDKHLDYRASILVRGGRGIFATTVKMHGLLGRIYFAMVRPFHGRIVRNLLARAG